jgi:uncharacterized heparinase superfamily protein
MPDRLHAVPPDPWPTNPARAEAIVHGADPLNGVMAQHGRADPETFDWLRDLGALDSEEARKAGCYFVRHWIERHGRDHTEAQQVDVLAARLVNWIGQYDFLCDGAETGFRTTFSDGLMRQVAALERSVKRAPQGPKRLAAAKALLCAGICLPRAEKRVARAMALIEPEIGRLVMADGGCSDRNPSHQLSVLQHLVDIRALLIAGHVDVPEYLQNAVDRVAPMLRFFRHGDGGLALFNGGFEEQAALIDLVLDQAKAVGKAPASAPHAGFQRLVGGTTTIIVDCGRPPPPVVAPDAHAGTLSFELSSGTARLIVNCGASTDASGLWRQLMRTTAAHSTLVVKDTNSSEVLSEGGIGRRPDDVACRRNSAQGATWLDVHHDGYVPRFGLVHHRRLYLTADGGDLRGEDSLTGGLPEQGAPFALRFHLHPSVAPRLEDETPLGEGVASLALPNGETWRFLALGGALAIEDSVYLGEPGRQQRTHQLVVTGETDPSGEDGVAALVKWAVKRIG